MNSTTRLLTLTVLGMAITVTAPACGSKNDAEPRLIAGGGVGDGAIDGVVNVHVIDEETDEPISGAKVYIGEASDEELLEGVTDTSGLIRFDDGSLGGPTTMTVVAADYVVATWFGADGANVTIPLDSQQASTTVDSATISGTITDWDQLPTPATNHFIIAIVTYSQTSELGGAQNEIEQPGGLGLGPNLCASFEDPNNCAWSVVSRTGTVAIYATIIDIDTKGTETDVDDTNEIIAYAYALDLEVRDGVSQSGVTLAMIDGAALADVTADVPPAPSALDQTAVLLGLELGASGVLVAGFAQDADVGALTVPDLDGDFAQMSYRAIAFAGNEGDDGDDDPMTATIVRGVTDLTADVEFDPWLPMANGLDVDDAGLYTFTPVDGTAFHGAALYDSDGDQVWNIALLDTRTAFKLPTIANDPRPNGPIDLTVDAFDGDVDLTDFAIDDFLDAFNRISKARTTL